MNWSTRCMKCLCKRTPVATMVETSTHCTGSLNAAVIMVHKDCCATSERARSATNRHGNWTPSQTSLPLELEPATRAALAKECTPHEVRVSKKFATVRAAVSAQPNTTRLAAGPSTGQVHGSKALGRSSARVGQQTRCRGRQVPVCGTPSSYYLAVRVQVCCAAVRTRYSY